MNILIYLIIGLIVLILIIKNISLFGNMNTIINTYKIVVARYNEDISWIKDNNVIIYNKGTPLGIANEYPLKNVGREAETYLHYIIDNYSNLPDVVVFTQANIADHRDSNDINYLLKIKDEALEYGKSKPTTQPNLDNINWGPTWNLQNGNWYLDGHYKDNKHILFIDWFKENIQPEYPEDNINVYEQAIFAVKKELILKHNIDYYKKLINLVNWDNLTIEAHFFERSWWYIFN